MKLIKYLLSILTAFIIIISGSTALADTNTPVPASSVSANNPQKKQLSEKSSNNANIGTITTKQKSPIAPNTNAKKTIVNKKTIPAKKPIVKAPSIKISGSHKINVGNSTQLHTQITNKPKVNQKLIWTSNNTKIASVNSSGKVVGKKAGLTWINALYGISHKSFKINVFQQTDTTLNKAFKHAKSNRLITLSGSFSLNHNIKLPSAKNVKINAKKASFSGPSGFFYTIKNTGLNWNGGTFNRGGHGFRLMHLNNGTFENMIFKQACGIGGHIFDLMGCNHVSIKHNQFIGYGNTTNLSKIRMGDDHRSYAESIQVDYANYSSGGAAFNPYGNHHFDGAPSSYITVTNNAWKPYYIGKKLISYAQVAIGQHCTIQSNRRMIRNINFSYNNVKDTLPMNNLWAEKPYFAAPVHFESVYNVDVKHNTFSTSKGIIKPENYIIFSNFYGQMRHSLGFNISNNKFIGKPLRSAIRLIAANFGHSITNCIIKYNKIPRGFKLYEHFGTIRKIKL